MRLGSIGRGAAGFVIAVTAFVSPQPAVAQDALEGMWTGIGTTGRVIGAARIVTARGRVEARFADGRGPFAIEWTGRDTIRIHVFDDPGCCTGRLVGEDTIRWSNGTQWRRQVAAADDTPDIVGSWGGGGGTIVRSGGGFTVRLSNGRGPFRGTFLGGDRIRVDFHDDPGCCTGVVGNGVIRWSNGTSWRRDR